MVDKLIEVIFVSVPFDRQQQTNAPVTVTVLTHI
jgi:hypothetical protein